MFINYNTMKKATFSLKLLKIGTSDTSLYKQDAVKFYKETCGFFAAITSHMIEKSPINYQIVCLVSGMDPVYIANENTVENCTLNRI